jgi:hypothetical protein
MRVFFSSREDALLNYVMEIKVLNLKLFQPTRLSCGIRLCIMKSSPLLNLSNITQRLSRDRNQARKQQDSLRYIHLGTFRNV